MNIVVCVKETFDSQTKIVLKDHGDIDTHDVQYVLNPYDEYALEEAVTLKEKFGGTVKVVTVSAGDPTKVMHHCLAVGADDATIISDPAAEHADAHLTALALSRFLCSVEFDLVFCGREAIDDGASEVPSRLAALLDLPQVNVVSKLVVENGQIKARRDIEGGAELISVPLPCVLSAQKDLNIPRYPPMRRILMAKKKTIHRLSFADLSISEEESSPFVQIQEITLPEPRMAGEVFSGPTKEAVAKLVAAIKEKANICQ
jgi:electron transfer flavoprotein beta subunit